MIELLILKDGKREVVSRDRHFSDLLREYMGRDAAEYYENRIKSFLDIVDEARSLLDGMDSANEIAETLRDIFSEVEYE